MAEAEAEAAAAAATATAAAAAVGAGGRKPAAEEEMRQARLRRFEGGDSKKSR